MSEDSKSIGQAAAAIMRDFSDPDMVRSSEEGGWNPQLWEALRSSGFTTISIPESSGGSGGDVADACTVLREVGRRAGSVPVAETSLLAGWALASAGLAIADGPMTTTVGDPNDTVTLTRAGSGARLDGRARRVPWAGQADLIVLLLPLEGTTHVVSVNASQVQVEPGHNLAGESRDGLLFDDVSVETVPAPDGVDLQSLQVRGALARSALATGALERVRELTATYTATRHQFGRPLSAFQAVQRHVVRIAEQSVTAAIATESAAHNAQPDPQTYDVAAAKIITGLAATIAAQASHQAHGAIGMTKEYELGQLTRRLWSWRDEFGSERFWSRDLGRQVATAGANELWPRITLGSRDRAPVGSDA